MDILLSEIAIRLKNYITMPYIELYKLKILCALDIA